jgi:hypothetical protein
MAVLIPLTNKCIPLQRVPHVAELNGFQILHQLLMLQEQRTRPVVIISTLCYHDSRYYCWAILETGPGGLKRKSFQAIELLQDDWRCVTKTAANRPVIGTLHASQEALLGLVVKAGAASANRSLLLVRSAIWEGWQDGQKGASNR